MMNDFLLYLSILTPEQGIKINNLLAENNITIFAFRKEQSKLSYNESFIGCAYMSYIRTKLSLEDIANLIKKDITIVNGIVVDLNLGNCFHLIGNIPKKRQEKNNLLN
jgi:hypothetical protein